MSDGTGIIRLTWFNGANYINKSIKVGDRLAVSGKINFYKKKYQITNPAYVAPIEKEDYVNKIIPKYTLTDGVTEKIYRKIIEQVLNKMQALKEQQANEQQSINYPEGYSTISDRDKSMIYTVMNE